MKIKIATWNMAQGNPTYRSSWLAAWDYFLNLDVDFYLFQEGLPYEKLLEDKTHLAWNPIGGRRNWGSGIYSKNYELTEEKINTKFTGVYTIANSQVESTKLTFISMYGLLDHGMVIKNINDMVSELVDDSIISDLSRNIILGGDLNASIQWDVKQKNQNHENFFERLKSHELEDCFKLLNKPYPLQTLRKINSIEPWQNDYLFISKKIEGNLIHDEAIVIGGEEVVKLSDHNPIVITLAL